MEVEKVKLNEVKEDKKNEKKKFTILGFSIWRILAYFIIYSVARVYYRDIIWNCYKRSLGK